MDHFHSGRWIVFGIVIYLKKTKMTRTIVVYTVAAEGSAMGNQAPLNFKNNRLYLNYVTYVQIYINQLFECLDFTYIQLKFKTAYFYCLEKVIRDYFSLPLLK